MLGLLITAVLLAQDPSVAAAKPSVPPKAPTFAQVVTEHFVVWDADANGTLSAVEVDLACVAPLVKGEAAAAAAAIKRIVRSGKYAVPELTLANLTASPPKPVPKAAAKVPAAADAKAGDQPAGTEPATGTSTADIDRRDSTERPSPQPAGAAPAATLPAPNFQSSFAGSLRKITAAKRELFLDPTPDLDHCRQGPLGDCYFVASVGAMVARDAAAVQKMVQQNADGSYAVTFGDGRSITVPELTDAELALSGSTGDEGLWLPVLEKAVGRLRQTENPARYKTLTATDAIAHGGSTSSMIRMLTGHTTKSLGLKRQKRTGKKGPDGRPILSDPVALAPVEELAARVRKEVGAALQERRLVTASTGTEKQPPGISGRHAYTVLRFDAAADTVTLWNPHGNSFRPKGEAGLKAGYATRAGVFTVPVVEFVQVFRGVAYETGESVTGTKPAVPTKEVPTPEKAKTGTNGSNGK